MKIHINLIRELLTCPMCKGAGVTSHDECECVDCGGDGHSLAGAYQGVPLAAWLNDLIGKQEELNKANKKGAE